MSFLHAGLLAAGLGAVSIPILIHLLMRRRRKPVEWGAMRFLLEAYKRTRRRLLIERWVLLALRCLLVAAAAVAIGRPLLGGGASGGVGGGVGTVYLVIDNSLASGALVGGESALKRHVAGALRTLSLMSDGDRAGLVLLGAPADPLIVPPSANLGSVREQVERVRGTEARADLAGALGAVGSSIADERARDPRAAPPDRTVVVVLSDAWRGSADLESALPRLPGGVRLLVSESGREADGTNVTVASAAARRGLLLPDQPDRAPVVTAVLRRSGPGVEREQASKVVLRAPRRAGGGSGRAEGLEGADEPVPAIAGDAVVRWSPGQKEATVSVAAAGLGTEASAGEEQRQPLVLTVSVDNDVLAGDNMSRVVIERRETLRVGLVAARRGQGGGGGGGVGGDPSLLTAGDWMALALRPRDGAAVEVVDLDASPMEPGVLAGLDAVVITTPDRLAESDWVAVRGFATGAGRGGGAGTGGLVMVMPPGDRTVHSWTDAMGRGLGLEWTVSREARVMGAADVEAMRVVVPTGGGGGSGGGGGGGVSGGGGAGAGLLEGLGAELAELARPVNVMRVLPVTAAPEGANKELALADGTGLVWSVALGAERRASGSAVDGAGGGGHGWLVVFAFAPELRWTDLPVKPLMVPLMQEIVRQGVGSGSSGRVVTAGSVASVPAPAVALRRRGMAGEGAAAGGGGEILVTDAGATASPMRNAGVWDAVDASRVARGVVVVNADADGGDVTRQPEASVGAWLSKALPAGQAEWVNVQGEGGGSASPGDGGGAASLTGALSRSAAPRAAGAWLMAIALMLAAVEMLAAWWATPKG